ncbi:tRNase Z TRZ1 isoform X1 [Arachis hypogaea]|uniref:tRNase Z TRZ1 isoform X1 n=1 Tax=Arachis hypogaea TaxID=3818 RepID=UPI000A2C1816|nr:tRNase Z TRZ1 isoform X1 [Arachis hypogaea]
MVFKGVPLSASSAESISRRPQPPSSGELDSASRELLFMEAKSEQPNSSKKAKDLNIEGYPVGGLSIGGHETCIMFPTLKVAFDIGRCPPRAVSQDFLLISHAHMDHIGGLPMYVATRGLYRMKPPTIIVPISVKDDVEKLFEVHRKMDHSELKHNLIGLDVGEEFYLRKDLKVKAFRTYHVIPSQGYILYYVRQKLKPEYIGLSGNEIKNLKSSGVEITYTLTEPEIAFTGDTMSDFIVDENNTDVLRARILVIECTFVNNSITVEHAKDYGHTHLSEIIGYAERFKNRAILLIHFSARYTVEEIEEAVTGLPPPLAGRTFALTEGF